VSRTDDIAYCRDLSRRSDLARHLAARFADGPARRRLEALAAFDAELEKTAETVSEPMLGQIRLAWWREAVAEASGAANGGGAPRAHPVVRALALAFADAPGIAAADLERLIDARERDLDPEAFAGPGGEAALQGYMDEIGRAWAAVSLAAIGAEGTDAEHTAACASACAWARELAKAPSRAAAGVCILPGETLQRAGVSRDAVLAGRAGAALGAALSALAIGPAGAAAAAAGARVFMPAAAPVCAAAAPAALAIARLARGARVPGGLAVRGALVRSVATGRIRI